MAYAYYEIFEVIIQNTLFMKFRDMTNEDDVKIAQNGQLTLVMATKNHEGEWKCLASNSEGNVEKKMNVKVKTHVKGMSWS